MSDKYLYEYAILRYTHDTFSGEFVNIGVVLFAANARRFIVRLNRNYGRVTGFFSGASGDFFRSYVSRLQTQLDGVVRDVQTPQMAIEGATKVKGPLRSVLADVLQPDDSAFRFDGFGSGITPDPEKAVETLYKRFVMRYIEHETAETRDNAEIWAKFRLPLSPKVTTGLKRQVVITKYEHFEFEHTFQNGKLHLIEPISLDLAYPQSIRAKGRQTQCKAELVTEEGKGETVHWILVGGPMEDSGPKREAYDDMLRLLRERNDPQVVRVVTEDRTAAWAVEMERIADIPHV